MFAPQVYAQILSRPSLCLEGQFGGVERDRVSELLAHGGGEESKKIQAQVSEELNRALPSEEPLRSAVAKLEAFLFPKTSKHGTTDFLAHSKGYIQDKYVFYIALRDELEREYFPLREARHFVQASDKELRVLISVICKSRRFYGLVRALGAIDPHEFPKNRILIWSELTKALEYPEVQAEWNQSRAIRDMLSDRQDDALVFCLAHCEGTIQRHSGTGNFYPRQYAEKNLASDPTTFLGLVPGIMRWLDGRREVKPEIDDYRSSDFDSWDAELFQLWKPTLVGEYSSRALFARANAGGLLRCLAKYDTEDYENTVVASWNDAELFVQVAQAYAHYFPDYEFSMEGVNLLGGERLIEATDIALKGGNLSEPLVIEFCQKMISHRK
jgi:hypothetical protein